MRREKIVNAFLCAALFAFTIFFFAPQQIYLTNRSEFLVPFPVISGYFLCISFCAALLLTIFLLALPYAVHKSAVSLLSVISFLMWFQGNILVWRYGVFDGIAIDWNKYAIRGIVDGALWVACISIGLLRPAFIYKIFRACSVALICAQLFSLSSNMLHAQSSSCPEYDFDSRNKFGFSARKNVIILIVDAFETTYFQEIIHKADTYKKMFTGFTYFRNALGGYFYTNPAIALILTGEYYDNSIPLPQFIENEFLSHSLPGLLKHRGFQVELYPFAYHHMYFDARIASNHSKKKAHRIFYRPNVAEVYDIALFRYAPQSIKKYIYHNQKWLFTSLFTRTREDGRRQPNQEYLYSQEYDFKFMKDMDSRARISTDDPIFKFYHLKGIHPPFNYNERLEYEELPVDCNGIVKHAMGTLELVHMFLTNLQRIGAYDNSLIFIVADHGLGPFCILEKTLIGDSKAAGRPIATDKARALPLILVKPFNRTGEMVISDAPVCLSDIPDTIVSELGLQGNFTGVSMFRVKGSDIRKRRFLSYRLHRRQDNGDFLPPMEEYIVSGFSWFSESWHATGRRLVPPKIPVYAPGVAWEKIKSLLCE